MSTECERGIGYVQVIGAPISVDVREADRGTRDVFAALDLVEFREACWFVEPC